MTHHQLQLDLNSHQNAPWFSRNVRHFTLRRGLGEATTWCCSFEKEVGTSAFEDFSKTLSGAFPRAKISFKDAPQSPPQPIRAQDAAPIHLRDGSVGIVCLQAQETLLPSLHVLSKDGTHIDTQCPALPRFRAFSVKKFDELLFHREFSYFLDKDPSVFPILQQLSLTNRKHPTSALLNGKISALQAGDSDWDFVLSLIAQYNSSLQTASQKKPLLLTGHRKHDDPRWLVMWQTKESFESMDLKEKRTLEPNDFSTGQGFYTLREPLNAQSFFPSTGYAKSCWVYHRKDFSFEEWSKWIDKTLPFFARFSDKSSEQYITSVEDHLSCTGSALSWETRFYITAPFEHIQQPRPVLRPWQGYAKVTNVDKKSPLVGVELAGFDEQHKQANALLLTASIGESGATGLHLSPEVGQWVYLSWSGHLFDPLCIVGILRTIQTLEESPLLQVEAPATFHFQKSLRVSVAEKTEAKLKNFHAESTEEINAKAKAVSLQVQDKFEID